MLERHSVAAKREEKEAQVAMTVEAKTPAATPSEEMAIAASAREGRVSSVEAAAVEAAVGSSRVTVRPCLQVILERPDSLALEGHHSRAASSSQVELEPVPEAAVQAAVVAALAAAAAAAAASAAAEAMRAFAVMVVAVAAAAVEHPVAVRLGLQARRGHQVEA